MQELVDKKSEITAKDVQQLEADVRHALKAAAAAALKLGTARIASLHLIHNI